MANVKSRSQKTDDLHDDCRTSRVVAVMPGAGRELYYCCLDEAGCGYALPVGYDVVCRHPESERFEKRPPVSRKRGGDARLNKKSRS